MNPEIKTKWLEALRSGKYKQGRGKLRSDDDSYCCLGVLCDVIGSKEWRKGEGECYYWENSASTLSFHVGETTIRTLIRGNDVLGWNFIEIADWIEQKL